MNTAQIIGVIVGLGTIILALAVQGGAFAFMLGRQHQRIATVERDAEHLKTKTESHAASIGELIGMKGLVEEVRKDVKSLLTERARAPSRRNTGS